MIDNALYLLLIVLGNILPLQAPCYDFLGWAFNMELNDKYKSLIFMLLFFFFVVVCFVLQGQQWKAPNKFIYIRVLIFFDISQSNCSYAVATDWLKNLDLYIFECKPINVTVSQGRCDILILRYESPLCHPPLLEWLDSLPALCLTALLMKGKNCFKMFK